MTDNCCGQIKKGSCCGSTNCPRPEEPSSSVYNDDDIWASDSDGNPEPQAYEKLETSDRHNRHDHHDHHNHSHAEDDDNDYYGQPVPGENRDMAALRRRFGKQGYAEGRSRWQEIGLQLGFDEGYPVGALLGVRCGRLLGKLQARAGAGDKDAAQKLAECVEDMKIGNVLSTEFVDLDHAQRSAESHQVVQKWQEMVDNA